MNPVLSTQMGTRHRAGIGVTEETDAIAVIVSEETGAVSLAVGGKIERDLSIEQLRERLGVLLSRYVAPSTLPTPITSGNEAGEGVELGRLAGGQNPAPRTRASARRPTAKYEGFFPAATCCTTSA